MRSSTAKTIPESWVWIEGCHLVVLDLGQVHTISMSVPICSVGDSDRMGLRLCVRIIAVDKAPRAGPGV